MYGVYICFYINCMNKLETKDIIEYKEGLTSQNEEKIWSDAFWSEYKPDYTFEKLFSSLDSEYFVPDKKNGSETDKQKFYEIFHLVKKNGYKLNISFLESLSSEQKKYISLLFFNIIWDNLDRKFHMGKSLLIRMYRWWQNDCWRNYVDHDKLYVISKNFEGFKLKYFRQAYDFMTRIGDKNIYHIINEYNLLINIDKDVESLEINETPLLWENFSIWVLHARSDTAGYWFTEKYWLYELDHSWNEKRFRLIWDEMEYNGLCNITILDRDHKSIHEDASWKEYNVYIDSPAWLALFYKGMPIACISFYIKEWKEIFINQIQKIAYYEYDRYGRTIWRHYSSVLDSIDRKEYIYNVVISLAKKYNISQITIQWAKNNRWIKEPLEDAETDYFANYVKPFLDKSWEKKRDKKFHLRKESAHKIYDVFAEKQWFQKDEEWNREKEI